MRLLITFPLLVTALAHSRSKVALIPRDSLSQMTIQEANNACGSNQQVSCCNKSEQGDNINQFDGVLSGPLGGVLADGLTLADQCSAISITARMFLAICDLYLTNIAFSDWVG